MDENKRRCRKKVVKTILWSKVLQKIFRYVQVVDFEDVV